MTSVLLIYPYFDSGRRSIFRFPPLGVAYVAASLRNAGHRVGVLDCTFKKRSEATEEALNAEASVVGVYSMAGMREESLMFARLLRDRCGMLVAGGPLPSCEPASFMEEFDVVVVGEGERAIREILEAYEGCGDLHSIPGIMYREREVPTHRDRDGVGTRSEEPGAGSGKSRRIGIATESGQEAGTGPAASEDSGLAQGRLFVKGRGRISPFGKGGLRGICSSANGVYFHRSRREAGNGEIVFNGKRGLEPELDAIDFPARDLLPNDRYIEYSKRKYGYAITTVITTRGCPMTCEFCSNAVFGAGYRERSAENVVDEVEQALALGYDRIHFADDVFTLNRQRVAAICEEIGRRALSFKWECLGRVDSVDAEVLDAMKGAGCDRVFFGIESGDDSVLKLMRKNITVAGARRAVEAAHAVGLKTGAFFILCYPGETDRTVLQSIRFAVSLPLDYLSFTVPYPLPGTALYQRVKSKITREWKPGAGLVPEHSLTYEGDFSEAKMKFGILKGRAEFAIKKTLRRRGLLFATAFEAVTDALFRLMR